MFQISLGVAVRFLCLLILWDFFWLNAYGAGLSEC